VTTNATTINVSQRVKKDLAKLEKHHKSTVQSVLKRLIEEGCFDVGLASRKSYYALRTLNRHDMTSDIAISLGGRREFILSDAFHFRSALLRAMRGVGGKIVTYWLMGPERDRASCTMTIKPQETR
jgi:hypothetical protein